MKIFKYTKQIITALFMLCIINLSYSNRDIIIEPFLQMINNECTFEEAKDEVAEKYPKELKQKYWYINLNGLFSKYSGQRVCNGVVILKNGMLTDERVDADDINQKAQRVEELSSQSEDLGIKFIYVQSPAKMDLNNELLPMGMVNEGNNNATNLLNKLEKSGVSVLDLRDDMSDTPEHIGEYFYKTDHHWNPLGAFRAFQEISVYLQNVYPDENINGYYQDIDNWEIHKKEDWFLGSRGKRTGTYFGGVDDLMWLTPKFETEMSMSNVYRDEFYYGDYSEANIRDEYIREKDYFNYNAYCVYIGGDYPLVKHRNTKAPVDKKILIVKDSFVLPLQTYLSTVFTEVDVIDMRHYEAGSLDEYILESMPDAVLMNFNANTVTTSDLVFGTGADAEAVNTDNKKEIYYSEEVNVDAEAKKAYNYTSIYDDFEKGKRYTLECDEVYVDRGDIRDITFKLYDFDNEKTYDCDMWDLEYCRKSGSYEWTFTAPVETDSANLIVYAGTAGSTEGNGITMSNVRIYDYNE